MIGYIKGKVIDVSDGEVLLENQNIGFRIRIPGLVQEQLPPAGEEVKLYTYMHVREDEISLFGFMTQDEWMVFQLLLSVNGVGPKGALGILSMLTCDDLRVAVHSQDVKAISKAPGIGAKTAQRVILDLKDRLKLEDILETDAQVRSQAAGVGSGIEKEAVEALVALGYSSSEAVSAVGKVTLTAEMSVEDCLKSALKYML